MDEERRTILRMMLGKYGKGTLTLKPDVVRKYPQHFTEFVESGGLYAEVEKGTHIRYRKFAGTYWANGGHGHYFRIWSQTDLRFFGQPLEIFDSIDRVCELFHVHSPQGLVKKIFSDPGQGGGNSLLIYPRSVKIASKYGDILPGVAKRFAKELYVVCTVGKERQNVRTSGNVDLQVLATGIVGVSVSS